jgi:hypothetical protein
MIVGLIKSIRAWLKRFFSLLDFFVSAFSTFSLDEFVKSGVHPSMSDL